MKCLWFCILWELLCASLSQVSLVIVIFSFLSGFLSLKTIIFYRKCYRHNVWVQKCYQSYCDHYGEPVIFRTCYLSSYNSREYIHANEDVRNILMLWLIWLRRKLVIIIQVLYYCLFLLLFSSIKIYNYIYINWFCSYLVSKYYLNFNILENRSFLNGYNLYWARVIEQFNRICVTSILLSLLEVAVTGLVGCSYFHNLDWSAFIYSVHFVGFIKQHWYEICFVCSHSFNL